MILLIGILSVLFNLRLGRGSGVLDSLKLSLWEMLNVLCKRVGNGRLCYLSLNYDCFILEGCVCLGTIHGNDLVIACVETNLLNVWERLSLQLLNYIGDVPIIACAFGGRFFGYPLGPASPGPVDGSEPLS